MLNLFSKYNFRNKILDGWVNDYNGKINFAKLTGHIAG